MSGCRHGFTLLRVVVSFSYGSVLEAVVCIQVYYTALYRPHGSTDTKSKTMQEITLCIICNALYTTSQSAVTHRTLRSQSHRIYRDAAPQMPRQSLRPTRPLTSLTRPSSLCSWHRRGCWVRRWEGWYYPVTWKRGAYLRTCNLLFLIMSIIDYNLPNKCSAMYDQTV